MKWEDQHEPRFQAICERVRAAGDDVAVLDVGAAPYHLTTRLASLPNVRYVDVIDKDDCNVECDPWPAENGSFDVIVMGAIIEHLFRPAYALSQARDAIREGGRLILSTPNGLSLKTRVETLTGLDTPTDGFPARITHQTVYDRHQHEYSRDELHDLLTKTGWACARRDIEGIQLSRAGLAGRVYERIGELHPSLCDQFVVSAHAGTRWRGVPDVYRRGLTARE